jgi:outer membrane cobalamin receptor
MSKLRRPLICITLMLLFGSVNPLLAGADQKSSTSTDSSDAQTYFLKGNVVTANRYEQQPFMVSQPITVFSAQIIQSQSPAIVPDLFREVPGVETNDAGPFRTRPVIRGMFGSRVLILVVGERLWTSDRWKEWRPFTDRDRFFTGRMPWAG